MVVWTNIAYGTKNIKPNQLRPQCSQNISIVIYFIVEWMKHDIKERHIPHAFVGVIIYE